jgi:hypothetical protein
MYSAKQVLCQGWQPPQVVWSSKGNAMRVAYLLQTSQARYNLLQWAMVARLSNLRAANLRCKRRAGLPLHPVARKYRTK